MIRKNSSHWEKLNSFCFDINVLFLFCSQKCLIFFFLWKNPDVQPKDVTPSATVAGIRPVRVVSSTSEEEEAFTEKFLKINCKYITDGKVMSEPLEICCLF